MSGYAMLIGGQSVTTAEQDDVHQYMALPFLRGQGYNVKSIMGGYKGWVGANLPVVKE